MLHKNKSRGFYWISGLVVTVGTKYDFILIFCGSTDTKRVCKSSFCEQTLNHILNQCSVEANILLYKMPHLLLSSDFLLFGKVAREMFPFYQEGQDIVFCRAAFKYNSSLLSYKQITNWQSGNSLIEPERGVVRETGWDWHPVRKCYTFQTKRLARCRGITLRVKVSGAERRRINEVSCATLIS